MTIQVLSFNNLSVSFNQEAYLNATYIAEKFNKSVNNYLRNERTQEYIDALAETLKSVSEENQLVITKKGGNDKTMQGTWLHPKLAIDFARWLNPKFAVWCDEQIEKILKGENKISVTSTVSERKPLRQAVTMLVDKKGISYEDAYHLIHQRFDIDSVEELNQNQINDAIQYVHSLIIQEALPQIPPKYFDLLAKMTVAAGEYLKIQDILSSNSKEKDELCNNIIKGWTSYQPAHKRKGYLFLFNFDLYQDLQQAHRYLLQHSS